MNLLLVIVCVFVVLSSRIVLPSVAVTKVYMVLLLFAVWVVELVMKMKVRVWCLCVVVVSESLMMVVVMLWK